MVDYISGTLHKRRSGFGKYMAKKWEKRGFVLSSEGVLAYYETEIPPADHNVTAARGFIDLNTTPFHLQTGASIDSMPTPYTIQICPIDGKLEQWKVCTETAGEFEIWRKALEVFATVPQTPLTPSLYASDDEEEEGAERGARRGASRSSSNTPVGRSGEPKPAGGGSAADRGRSASPVGRSKRSNTVAAGSGSGSTSSSNVAALISPQRITPASISGSYASAAAVPTTAAPLPVPPPRKPASSAGGAATAAPAAPTAPERPAASANSSASAGKEGMANAPASAPAPASTAKPAAAAPRRRGGGLKLKKAEGSGLMTQSQAEVLAVVLVLNVCFIAALVTPSSLVSCAYVAVANAVVVQTLMLRAQRLNAATTAAEKAEKNAAQALAAAENLSKATALAGAGAGDSKLVPAAAAADPSAAAVAADADAHDSQLAPAMATRNGKPIAGCTFTQVFTKAPNVPEHSWSTCDFRDFNVRVGPNYDKYKKKAPSAAPLYEPFAVDVICTKTRKDHISQRMDFGFDAKEVQTNNPHVPPVLVIQMQIPSEPPASMFSTVEDGPGWAIVMYFRITPDTCEQLKDLATASPAVRLFQQYCEKAEKDSAWRARFKVICSCLNMDQMGLPNMIVQYNAKPVLIRRTGTFYRGENHVEFDVHVHKFANLAKQSIHMISSRCGQMYMQIGFVVEGRDDAELPETLFACVGVNKPQEDRGEFLFPEDQEDEEEEA